MVKIYKTQNASLLELEQLEEDIWINIESPTESEILLITEYYHIDIQDIRASLDNEETSRVKTTPDYTLILIDIPVKEVRNNTNAFTTIPLSIILTNNCIITSCLQNTEIMNPFLGGNYGNIDTKKKMRFVYQILLRAAVVYQTDLRLIDIKRKKIEKNLNGKIKKTDLIELHVLESNLVYFETSLRADSIVLNKLLTSEKLAHWEDDAELLDNAIIENRQAIEMTAIYRSIISGTRELLASIIDTDLNSVMKLMTSITLVMAIPTIISGFYGMNVNSKSIPLADVPGSFLVIGAITVLICVIAIGVLKKKDML